MVPNVSVRRMLPASLDGVRSPQLSDSATVPRRPRASRVPNESLTPAGSPAGTVMPRSSEQVPAGTRHWGSRSRPAAVDRWLNEGRRKLPLRCPRTRIRRPVPGRTVRLPLPPVTRTRPPAAGTLNPTE